MKIRNIEDLNKLKETGMRSLSPKRPKISISMSTCGLALGADEIYQKMVQEKDTQGRRISFSQTGCSGFCDLEPMAILRLPRKPPLVYTRMTVERALQLIKDVNKKKFSEEGLLCKIEGIPSTEVANSEFEGIPDYHETPPFKDQRRLLLKNCGLIDPMNVAEYVAMGGYYSLYKAIYQMTPEEVLEEVDRSGLRGRGGAWFSTGFKWKIARKSPDGEKFIICNADEGDPGAYKDRTILEGDPFKLFEGVVLAGYAIGSHQGLIYLREEYPYTYEFLNKAIDIAKRYGLLGRNILGSHFNFALRVIRGGGSYVCGEETALMDSIEGEVGDPRLRPPFPIERGLWERPTVVNNVETLANIPLIIEHGSEWYAGIGTEKAKGTKILPVVGRVKQPGLYEVALGTNLAHLIFDLAGGPLEGSQIKAVQVGSPFGSFIPGDRLDISLDPETLTNMGSMIGSGVIVVLDQETCLVDTLLHLLSFFEEESCGKCVPCREGIPQMKEIMAKIHKGRSAFEDLTTLSELGETIRDFALCGLGGGAPSLILNGIEDFKQDFEAHITTGRCPWPS
ncbi:MAG TPA: NADH-ubiquinone oxidoreductase-F iron-sulfur binding region domain-containing protein [Acidobacteriota bacterium]|nr:NADH-ubiquinone oxidoreductase-F iron-sulfur binding region domain-containing protein [Acidobacteriota bacterium]